LRSNITEGSSTAWFIQGLITTYVGNAVASAAQTGATVHAKVAWPYWTELQHAT